MKENQDKLNSLGKLGPEGKPSGPKRLSPLEKNRRKIRKIINSLKYPSSQYKPIITLNMIYDYINDGDRIIYSEITGAIYGMSDQERDTVSTNVSKLADYLYDHGTTEVKIKGSDDHINVYNTLEKAVVQLWDHINLACQQSNFTTAILLNSAEKVQNELTDTLDQKVKDKMDDEIEPKVKNIERDYITILGIFASIVIAFVGGMTFSTSVLENIDAVSPYRLVFVTTFICYAFVNVINLLLKYMTKLNHIQERPIQIDNINKIFYGVMSVTAVAWLINAHQIRDCIVECIGKLLD